MAIDKRRNESRDYWGRRASEWDEEYARIWEASREVSEWLIEKLDPEPGQTVLELAAGPGMTGFMAAERIGPRGKLISTDFAKQMVEVARRRAQEAGLTNVEFRMMDAEKMDLEDSSVDGVICRWGLMLMFDRAAVVSETRRVLKEGGRFVFSVWGPPIKNRWTTLIGPVLVRRGLIEPSDPFGPGGMFSMSERATIEGMLTKSGFEVSDFEEIALTWTYDDFEHYWRTVSTPATPLGTAVSNLPDTEASELENEIREEVSDFTDASGHISLPALALNVAATFSLNPSGVGAELDEA